MIREVSLEEGELVVFVEFWTTSRRAPKRVVTLKRLRRGSPVLREYACRPVKRTMVYTLASVGPMSAPVTVEGGPWWADPLVTVENPHDAPRAPRLPRRWQAWPYERSVDGDKAEREVW